MSDDRVERFGVRLTGFWILGWICLPLGAQAEPRPLRATQLSMGNGYGCAVLEDKTLRCWGGNYEGVLGLGDDMSRGDSTASMGNKLPPPDLGKGKKALSIVVGSGHTCAILTDGALKCWGINDFGQLGQGDTSKRGITSYTMGENLLPIQLGAGHKALKVEVGYAHTCALLDDSTVKCWGSNDNGQLGVGDKDARFVPSEAVNLGKGRKALDISAGGSHTCALLDNHQIKCWGDNSFGQLGQGDQAERGISPATLGDGLNPIDLGTGQTALQVKAGIETTCALLSTLQVKCWGANYLGQLGQEDTLDRGSKPGDMGDHLKPIDLGTGLLATSISEIRGMHACAILINRAIKCWGANGSGRLGLGDQEARGAEANTMGDGLGFALMPKLAQTLQVSTGNDQTCALLSDGSVHCWGGNSYGQLGLEDTRSRGADPKDLGDALPALNFGTVN